MESNSHQAKVVSGAQGMRRNLSFQSVKDTLKKSDHTRSQSTDKFHKRDVVDLSIPDDNNKYVVKGVLNISSTNSNSNHSSSNNQGSHAYRAKLISKKEKAHQNQAHRSQSTTRQESSCQTNNDIFTFMRRAKRSLSAPRKRDVEIDTKITPEIQKEKINQITMENYEITKKNFDRNKIAILEQNLRKFDDERRKFELEKLKFIEEKKDWDKIRLQRFERYRKQLKDETEMSPCNVKIARKIVIDPERVSVPSTNEEAFFEPQLEPMNLNIENSNEENGEIPSSALPKSTENLNEKIKEEKHEKQIENIKAITDEIAEKMRFKEYSITIIKEFIEIWRINKLARAEDWNLIKANIRKCLSEVLILVIFCGLGGLVFRFVEGNFENLYKCGVKRVKRDFIDQLWVSSHNLREDDWKSMARTRLRKFEEELHVAFEMGMTSYSGHTAWNFVNGVLYCLTVISTIGYGHITPSTNLGRAITIIYAIFGIPIFLIMLADFGKLLTRGLKFLWLYVRRVYYTGSCRKVRKTAPAQEMMKGLNVMYNFVKRPSVAFDTANPVGVGMNVQTPDQFSEAPSSPMPVNLENVEIDDEFNLPISVAITILIIYMIIGALMYWISEPWTFFESFYFIFVSISTIGLGDFVPSHPIYMLFSIVYLIFGLALTSMCINVVQLKLSESFQKASAKISTTIGMQIAEAASQQESQSQHGSTLHSPEISAPIVSPTFNFNDAPVPVMKN